MAAKLVNRVASLRIAAGLTQSELAARIHVSPETVAAIENRFRAVPTNDDGVVRRAVRVHRKGTVIDP